MTEYRPCYFKCSSSIGTAVELHIQAHCKSSHLTVGIASPGFPLDERGRDREGEKETERVELCEDELPSEGAYCSELVIGVVKMPSLD